MSTQKVVIEDWDGDGGIRIPDEVLQELGVLARIDFSAAAKHRLLI